MLRFLVEAREVVEIRLYRRIENAVAPKSTKAILFGAMQLSSHQLASRRIGPDPTWRQRPRNTSDKRA